LPKYFAPALFFFAMAVPHRNDVAARAALSPYDHNHSAVEETGADPANLAVVKPVVDHRHRVAGKHLPGVNREIETRFAHHDLALATDASATPLETANKEKFNEALKALADVVNAVEGHYFRNFTSFEHIAGHNGAATLLHVLGDGVKAKERRQKTIADGKFDELDNPEQI
jgi:hypothetical protein